MLLSVKPHAGISVYFDTVIVTTSLLRYSKLLHFEASIACITRFKASTAWLIRSLAVAQRSAIADYVRANTLRNDNADQKTDFDCQSIRSAHSFYIYVDSVSAGGPSSIVSSQKTSGR